MKIKQGRIKNINKKLVAGALVFVLVSVPLTGCDAISIDNINYVVNEQGNMGFTVDYNTLQYCSFYRVYNNKLDKEYFTICLIDEYNGSYFIKTYDIFTKEELKISENSFRAIKPVNHYLEELGMVKESYTETELNELLELFCSNQKVKTK
jgi:hypothetical protein